MLFRSVEMRAEIKLLHQRTRTTTVYVTHDQVEAMTLGDRIALFEGGRVAQVGPPLTLYEHPCSRFVAGFLGQPRMNFLPAGQFDAAGRALFTGRTDPLPAGWTLGVRPDHLQLHGEGTGLAGRVERLEHVGDAVLAWVKPASGGDTLAVRLAPAAGLPGRGACVGLRPVAGRVHAFDADGLARPLPAATAFAMEDAAATPCA